jgi:hypothetical protein
MATRDLAIASAAMPATDANADPEDAIRHYLLYLDNPNHLRDEDDIQKKTQAVLDASDPIAKLKALSELERAAKVDEAPLRAGFVEHARGWAEAEGVPVGAFRELKVPDDLLREAGFDVATSAARGRGGNGTAGGHGRQRAKAVPVEHIKDHVLAQTGTFQLTDIMGAVGGSPATVRKAVDELIEAGDVERLGPVPDYAGRGRAPIQYSRS